MLQKMFKNHISIHDFDRFAGDSSEELTKGVNYTESPHATSTLTISVTREDNLKEYRFVRLGSKVWLYYTVQDDARLY